MSAHATTLPIAPQKSGLDLFFDVLFAPVKAADQIAGRRRSLLLSLSLYILALAALWVLYYQKVDFEWLRSYLTDSALRRHPGADASQVRHSMAQMSPQTMMLTAIVGGFTSMLMMVLVRTVYHHLVARLISDRELPFMTWLALICWSLLPNVLGLLLSLVYWALGDLSHVTPGHLSLSSLNSTLLHLPAGHTWSLFADSMDLTLVWGIAFTSLAMARLLEIGRLKSLAWTALPYVVFYSAWALLNLR